jgi:hypothetical protein
MKNFKIFGLFVLACLLFSSCKNDDDAPSGVNPNELIGTWLLVAETLDGVPESIPCEFLLDFSVDTVVFIEYYGVNCQSVDVATNEYYVDGNEIINTDQFGTFAVEILTLNGSELVIMESDEYVVNGQVYYDEIISTFVRQ